MLADVGHGEIPVTSGFDMRVKDIVWVKNML